ncbi:type III pantothenate kinase [bacterium]|nr:type III pantothenate kinase [bacterium]
MAIDIGNTNITTGVFDGDSPIYTFRLNSDKSLNKNEYIKLFLSELKNYSVTSCIISSVVKELSEIIKDTVKTLFGIEPVIVSSELNLGFNIITANPKEAGADRIANVCAAKNLYNLPAVVVDAGTATTFDIIDKNGDFTGGIIMPGIGLQLDVLCGKTSKLPLVEIKEQNFVIGSNTEENILSGVIRGHVCAIEGLLSECEKELKSKPTIIITGGFSSLVSKYINKYDVINPNLTLMGLKILYDLNL